MILCLSLVISTFKSNLLNLLTICIYNKSLPEKFLASCMAMFAQLIYFVCNILGHTLFNAKAII